MKKILLLMSVLMLAAFTSSCENTENGYGNGPETEGGTFVAEGISASFKYATDFYNYIEDEKCYLHLLIFSNKPIDARMQNMKSNLKEGERLDLLYFGYKSEDKELLTSEIPIVLDIDGHSELPNIFTYALSRTEGTSDPESPKEIYSFFGGYYDEPSIKISKLVIIQNGDSYKLSSEEMIMDCFESGEIINGTFKYNGKIKFEQNDDIENAPAHIIK